MPSISSFRKARGARSAAKDKAKALRRETAFNAAVGLTLGDTVTGWSLSPNSTVTRSIEGKKDRVYSVDQQKLTAEVVAIRTEREEKISKA